MSKMNYYWQIIIAEINMLPLNLAYLFSAKKRSLYIGCTRMGNLGDEAIFEAIKELLSSKFFLYELPYHKPTSGKYFRKLFFRSPDYIFLGGGTIIRKSANESYLRILNRMITKWPNAKIAIIGPGVVDVNFADYIGFPINIEDWKLVLNKSNFISVRGVLSFNELNKWGLKQKVHIFHDPAIYFAKPTIKSKTKLKKIGINFANIGNRIYGKNKKKIELFAFQIVEKLIDSGWEIYLYPTTKSDLNYMLEDIGLKKIKELNIYENYTDIEHSLKFLEDLDVFLGQRLHSIIFSASVYTPFHALEYEPKTCDFLTTLDMDNYSTRVDELDVNIIFEKIEILYSQIDNEQQKLFSKVALAKKEQTNCTQWFVNNL
jgi:hypothetical protein